MSGLNGYQLIQRMNEAELLQGFNGPVTQEQLAILEERIEQEKKKSKACEERNYDKMQYSNPHDKEINRLRTIIDFVKVGASVERTNGGFITVNKKYIISLANPKWRVKGKNKWYWYTTPEQFMDKYVNR